MADEGKASIVLSAVDRTKAAFESAKRNMAALKAEAAGLVSGFAPITAVIGSLGVGLAGLSFKNVVDGLDRLNDVKDATGASIENISGLEDVAARTGTSLETVESTLVRFNKALSDAKPDNEIGLILKEIGLSADELRKKDPAQALLDTAAALSKYADDGNKARVFQELFGKSVKEVAPFLKDLAEAGKLNATVTTEQAQAAEDFNKQLFALQKNITDAARNIFGDLIPALNDLFGALTKAKGAAAGGSLLDGILGTNPVDRLRSQNQAIAAEVSRTGDVLDRLVEEQSRKGGAGNDTLLDGRIAKTRQRLDGLRTKAAQAAQQLKDLADQMDGGPQQKAAEQKQEPENKPSLPNIPDASALKQGAADAEAAARRVLDGRIRAIQTSAESERDILTHREQVLKGLYDLGDTNLKQFYAEQDSLRQQNLEVVRRAADAEIAELEKARARPGIKPQDREDLSNKIAEVRAKADAAQRESDQASEISAVERRKTTQELISQVSELDVRIKSLAGDQSGAAIIENARQVAQARKLLEDAGQSPEKADQLEQALDVQRQFNDSQREFALLSQQAANAEERAAIQARQGGKGLIETEESIKEVRQQSLTQLDSLIQRVEAYAAVTKDPSVLQFLDDLKLRYEALQESVDPKKLRFDAAADNIGDAIADGLERAVVEGGKLSDILKGIERDIVSIITREAITKPLAAGIGNIIKGTGSFSDLGSIFGIGGQKKGTVEASPLTTAVGAVTGGAGFLGGFLGGEQSGGLAETVTKTTQAFSILTESTAAEAAASEAASSAMAGLPSVLQSVTSVLSSFGGDILSSVSSIFSGGSGGGGSSFVDFFASFFHEGGVVGEAKDLRKVSFDTAPRYHTGGIAGLKADEVPSVLLKGEEVLTKTDPRHRDNLSTKVFERLQSMKEGASLTSLEGFDTSSISTEKLIERMASDKERDSDSWGEVTRYHTGGIAGLAPDEVPAVLRKGEEVLTDADPRHRDNYEGGRSQTIVVQVTAAPNMNRATALQQGEQVGKGIQRAMGRNG